MLENTEGANKNGQSRETGKDEEKQNKKDNAICVGHHYVQANSNNINRRSALLQTTGGKNEPNIVFMWKL